MRHDRESSLARAVKRFTSKEHYVCDSCGWHGWRTPPLAPSVPVRLQPKTRVRAIADPISAAVGEDANPPDTPLLLQVEKPSGEERTSEQKSKSSRVKAPSGAPPLAGSPAILWMSRLRSDVRRFLQRVPYEQFLSSLRRPEWRRPVLPPSNLARSSAIFALGLAAGAFVVWTTSESALQAPATGTRSPMAVSPTTGMTPAEHPAPSQLDAPIGSVSKVSTVGPPLPPAPTTSLDRPAAVEANRPAPSQPEGRSTTRSRPTTQRTQQAAGAASGTFVRSRGSLAIESRPPGARVSLDGRRVGATPLVLNNVIPGTHLVRVEADGYQVWAWTARVVANQRNRVSVKLFRSANP